MIRSKARSLNIKGGKTLIGDIEYNGRQISSLFLDPSTVWDTYVQDDGKIIIGGSFTIYSGSSSNYIVRINPNGTIDPDFNVSGGFNNTVFSVTQQSDGKIIAVGSFNNYSGSLSNRIIRINPSGSIDTTFNVGTGFNAAAYSVIQQSDGKIVAGGEFTTYSGSTSNGIVRINPNGTIDPDFNISGGFNNFINSVIQQSDGKIVAVGDFTSYSGSLLNRIVRINPSGSIDTTFNVGTGFNFLGDPIIQQSDGKLVAGGEFTTYSGSTSSKIVRINPDGTKDTTFNIGTGFDFDVYSIFQQPDDKLVVGGFFTSYSGSTSNKIIRINSDGTRDTTFNVGTGFSNNNIYSIFQQPTSELIIGGDFTTYSGSIEGNYDGIINLNTDGTINNNFKVAGGVRTISNVFINNIVELNNKDILIGGKFRRNNNFITQSLNGLVLLDENLNFKQAYPFTSPSSTINSVIQQFDGKIVAGGNFTSYSGSTSNRIVRINPNGTRDTTFNVGTGFNGVVRSIIQQQDSQIVVGGEFSNYSGSIRDYIVSIAPSGSINPSFNIGVGFDSFVYTIIQQSDGRLVAGGDFTSYSGSLNNRIVRINPNGTKDTSFNIGDGITLSLGIGSVDVLDLEVDGNILVGGNFDLYSGSAAEKIVRINPNGTKDTTFNTGTGFLGGINSIFQQSNGKILAGGGFFEYSGSLNNRIVRININGTKDTTFNIGTGFDLEVRSVIQQSNGNVLAGGGFTTYSGSGDFNLVSINSNGNITKERTN